MKKCLQKEKNFLRRKFQRQNFKWKNFRRRRYHVPKFNAGKIPCGEISRGEISCGEIKRGENFTRWNFLRWNFQQRNLTRRKTPYLLIKYFKSTKNALFWISSKFNHYRRKLMIAPFFAKFHGLQGQNTYEFRYYTLHSKKMEKLPNKYFFGKKTFFSHFQGNF